VKENFRPEIQHIVKALSHEKKNI